MSPSTPPTTDPMDLVSTVIPYIQREANRYAGAFNVPSDDLMQEGMLTALKAQRRYDPNRGMKFLSYAGKEIRNAIIRAAIDSAMVVSSSRPEYFKQRITYLDAKTGEKHAEEVGSIFHGSAEEVTGIVDLYDLRKLLASSIALLTERQQYILKSLYFDHRSLKDIAEELGVSHQGVHAIAVGALKRLRRMPDIQRLAA
jgi:RNA polymerase sigma factor (sigma-70 family)